MNNTITWEVSNVYRTNVSRRRVYKKNKRTKQSLEQQAMALCKDSLSERYIHNAFGNFDSGYIYYDSYEEMILSFCLWKVYKDTNTLHILLLCSHDPSYGLGKQMVADIEYYCFENKIDTITLSPATQSLFEYYANLGFTIDSTNTTQMIKHLSLPQIHMTRKKNKTRRAEKRHYPVIASMMPIDTTTWKTELF